MNTIIEHVAAAGAFIGTAILVLLLAAVIIAGLLDRKTWRTWSKSSVRPKASVPGDDWKILPWIGMLPFIVMGRGVAVVFVKGRAHRNKKAKSATTST